MPAVPIAYLEFWGEGGAKGGGMVFPDTVSERKCPLVGLPKEEIEDIKKNEGDLVFRSGEPYCFNDGKRCVFFLTAECDFEGGQDVRYIDCTFDDPDPGRI